MAFAYSLGSDISRFYARYKSDLVSIRRIHENGESPREVVREITDATDTLILDIYTYYLQKILHQDEPPPHLLLLAQGGYGRRELHPQSDVDILFLHNRSLSEDETELVKEVFRSLYDLGFQVGHCCRSYQQAFDVVSSDSHSRTAMCESRFLAGNWRSFEQFKDQLWRQVKRNRQEYIKQKIAERKTRIGRYGTTINITEPHLKESPGGLRDYHFGLWLGSLLKCNNVNLVYLKRSHLIDDLIMTAVEKALEFLWRVRTDLHFLTGKEQDLLVLSFQHEISARLGYKDRGSRLAEEEMMRDYYLHARTLLTFAERVIDRCTPKSLWSFIRPKRSKSLHDGFYLRNNHIHIPPLIHFYEHHPRRFLMTFHHAAEQGAELAEETILEIRDNLELVDRAFLHDKQNAELLRRFFTLPQGIEKALQEMRRTGFLEKIYPEWRGVSSLVRYDLVHRFTVDEHSLLCLYNLENLQDDRMNYSGERYSLWSECKEKDVLRLAVLFHDIGKGREGDHSIAGAELVNNIAGRMRLPEIKRKRLVFLIENHLLMNRTAQHRDLADPQVVADFSDAFERLEDLNMMYLLTYVDSKSVSPESMTEWKNNLLWELYLNARNIFLNEYPTEEERRQQNVTRKEQLIETLAEKYDRSFVRKHLDNLPSSYLWNQSINSVRQHLAGISAYDGKTPVTRFYPHLDPGCREIVLVCHDKVGLFNRICAAVTIENFNIQEARLNTRADGIVANNIVIRDAIGNQEITEARQALLQERITNMLLSYNKVPPIPKAPKEANLGRSRFTDRVRILNDISAKYTVIEVRCTDRRGVLQALTSELSAMNLNIHFARIITEGNRITNVFYVADTGGGKIQQDKTIERLREALQTCITLDHSNE